jgi:hypothetical protein
MKKNKRPPQALQKTKTKQPIWKQANNGFQLVGWLRKGELYRVIAGNETMLHIELVNNENIFWADPTNLWIDRFVVKTNSLHNYDLKSTEVSRPICNKIQGICPLQDKDNRACLFCSV